VSVFTCLSLIQADLLRVNAANGLSLKALCLPLSEPPSTVVHATVPQLVAGQTATLSAKRRCDSEGNVSHQRHRRTVLCKGQVSAGLFEWVPTSFCCVLVLDLTHGNAVHPLGPRKSASQHSFSRGNLQPCCTSNLLLLRPTFPSHCSRCFRAAHYGVIAAMGHAMGQMTHLPIEALLELRIR
jgi:hypothetical protein